MLHKDSLFLNSDILINILNTDFCLNKDLEMIHIVAQLVALNSITNGTLTLGMIFTAEVPSKHVLIVFHCSNMVLRLFTTKLKKSQFLKKLKKLKVLVKLELEMTHIVAQLVALNSITNGTLTLGMIFTAEVPSKRVLIVFHYSNMEQRLFITKLKKSQFLLKRMKRLFKVLVKLEVTRLDHQLVLLNGYNQD